MADSKMVLCVRCADLAEPIPGAIKTPCSICGAKVWISPSSLEFMSDKPDITVGCNECFQVISRTKMMQPDSEPIILTSVPGVHVDIERFVEQWMGGLT